MYNLIDWDRDRIVLTENIEDVVQGHRRVVTDFIGDEWKLTNRRPDIFEMFDFLVTQF